MNIHEGVGGKESIKVGLTHSRREEERVAPSRLVAQLVIRPTERSLLDR